MHHETEAPTGAAEGDFPDRAPWVLLIHRPGIWLLRDTSRANIELVRIIQNAAGFPELLDETRALWRSDSMIHNDVKFDNCLVGSLSRGGRTTHVKIVDWEFAGRGDACWDAGAVLARVPRVLVVVHSRDGQRAPRPVPRLARYPLSKIQPAIRAFWREYIRGMGLDPVAADEWLLRTVRYAAARLLQTGFEQMQKTAVLTGNVICLIPAQL